MEQFPRVPREDRGDRRRRHAAARAQPGILAGVPLASDLLTGTYDLSDLERLHDGRIRARLHDRW